MNFEGDNFGWCSMQLLVMWLAMLSNDLVFMGRKSSGYGCE